MWEKRLVENVIWERELAGNIRIPSYGGRGYKIAQKNVTRYLNVP